MQDLADLLQEIERALPPGSAAARARLGALKGRLRSVEDDLEAARADAARYRALLGRTVEVLAADGLGAVAERLMEGMCATVGASRGALGLVVPGGWRVVACHGVSEAELREGPATLSTTAVREALEQDAPVVAVEAAAEPLFHDKASVQRLHLQSIACLPIGEPGRRLGFVYLDDPTSRGLFDPAALDALRAWLPLAGEALRRALRDQAEPDPVLRGVISRSPRFRAELARLLRVAAHPVTLLLLGESGTGKSLIARQVHAASPRAPGPFIHINCGAIPESLLESELFGAEAGAFTGARTRRVGCFEAANGGTLFLDELDTMPVSCQSRLLVALQERQITRLGSSRPLSIDVRLIAAMNTDPARAVAEGRLREDLYYRLAVIEVRLPPLRERPEDLPLLAEHMLVRARERYALPPLTLSPSALDELLRHPWPGNVRELENVLDRAALLAEGGRIASLSLPGPASAPPSSKPASGRGIDSARLRAEWERHGGRAADVAAALGVSERHVWRLKARFNVS